MKLCPMLCALALLVFLPSCSSALPNFDPLATEEETAAEETAVAPVISTVTLSGRRFSFAGEETAIAVRDDLLTMKEEGVYRLTGDLAEGGVAVDVGAFGVVRLILDGVSIRSTRRPAIEIVSAAAVIIETAEGSVNLLRSSREAVIRSSSNLLLTGEGSLSLGGADEAIAAEGRVSVTSGIVHLTASACGIRSEVGVELSAEGEVAINAARVGILTRERSDSGGIVIRGGRLVAVCAEAVLCAQRRICLAGGKGSFDAPRLYQCPSEVLHTGGEFPRDGR